MGKTAKTIRRSSCARGIGKFHPHQSAYLVSSTVTAIGTISTWPLEKARPDFEHAFMRFVSDSQSQMRRRKFWLKRHKGVPDGSW